MAQEGGFLPPAGDECWGSEAAVCAAAGSDRDSVPKLRWLAGRGTALGSVRAVREAAARGDLAAVRLLVGHWRGQGAGGALPQQGDLQLSAMLAAVESRRVPTAMWLLQQGCGIDGMCFIAAIGRGHLPMVRWLLQAGCPRDDLPGGHAVFFWPGNTAADAEALLAAVQLLAAAGWPLDSKEGVNALIAAAMRQPWAVVRAVLSLSDEPAAGQLSHSTLMTAAAAGCEATLEAMADMRAADERPARIESFWYDMATVNRDRGTLTCLRRLGVPLHGDVLAVAAKRGAPLPLLRWLVEHYCGPCRSELIQDMLGVLGAGYPAPREQERREVEAWLRGLLGAELQGEGGGGGAGAENG